MAKQDMAAGAPAGSEPRWEKGWQLRHDLGYEVAQLELLASRPVRQVAHELVAAHEKEALRLTLAKPGQDDYEGRRASQVKIEALEETRRLSTGRVQTLA